MAYFDRENGRIIVRVVYDGAPEAGKTTSVQAISQSLSAHRRGELQNPGQRGQRTEYFDWLDFQGGFVLGYAVRCQLLAVPGQPGLLKRRRYLLQTADAVVFVADSRREAIEDTVEAFGALQRIIKKQDGDAPPVGFIVQANKQDAAQVLTPLEISQRLGLDHSVPVMGAKALSGDGIMPIFIVAMRLAVDRISGLSHADALDELPPEARSPEYLYRSLKELDARPDEMEMGQARGVELHEDSVEALATDFAPEHAEALAGTRSLRIPAAGEIQAGHIWPSLTGRSILAAINGVEEINVRRQLSPWAPEGSVELHSENGWIMHTCEQWVHAEQAEARDHLMRFVRMSLLKQQWTPEGRSFILAEEADQWRIWMITPDVVGLRQDFERALRSAERGGLTLALQGIQRAIDSLAAHMPEARSLGIGGLDDLAVSKDRLMALVCRSEPRAESVGPDPLEAISAEFVQLLLAAIDGNPDLPTLLTHILHVEKVEGRVREGLKAVLALTSN